MKQSLITSLLIFSLSTIGQSQLDGILEEIDRIEDNFSIDNPIWRGEHPETYPILELDKIELKTELLKSQLTALEAIDEKSLSKQDRINRAIKMLQLKDDISSVKYNMHLITINAEGGRFNSPIFFLSNLPFGTEQDYKEYLKWLPSFTSVINQEQDFLQRGIENGVVVPKVIAQNAIKLLEPWTTDLESNPFYAPVLKMPASIDDESRAELSKDISSIIEKQIIPAYKDLKQFLEKKYLKKASESVGIGSLKNGKEYYETRIRHFTTLDMSPDSVFALGQQEVARIKARMNEIIRELEFQGSFQDFLDFLRTDPQFYAKTPDELLSRAAWISKKAEGELPKLFSDLYELPFTVAPVPANIAPTYTGGRYVPGNRRQNTPGTYWVNSYNLPSRPFYTLPALSLHEAVPGHHLQMMIAAEQEDLPEFRNTYYISAFGEGWGLYSEYLGEEMGIYTTPYEWFGRYTYEMWRACRLVVDVGLHYKGWTRKQAVDFMAGNTALSLHEVNTEIDRYIGWPGQAVSYKIGELTIKALRSKAESQLGSNFDIQEFHKRILQNGSVPLTILQEEIDDWIQEVKSAD